MVILAGPSRSSSRSVSVGMEFWLTRRIGAPTWLAAGPADSASGKFSPVAMKTSPKLAPGVGNRSFEISSAVAKRFGPETRTTSRFAGPSDRKPW